MKTILKFKFLINKKFKEFGDIIFKNIPKNSQILSINISHSMEYINGYFIVDKKEMETEDISFIAIKTNQSLPNNSLKYIQTIVLNSQEEFHIFKKSQKYTISNKNDEKIKKAIKSAFKEMEFFVPNFNTLKE